MISEFDRENMRKLWLEFEPTARSPYALYDHPPMWLTISRDDGFQLYSCPGITQVKEGFHRYVEVPGVRSQWMFNGKWHDQGMISTFEHFEGYAKRLQHTDQPSLNQLAVITDGCRWGDYPMKLAPGALVVVHDCSPDPEMNRCIVRDAFSERMDVIDRRGLVPLDPDVKLTDAFLSHMKAVHGEKAGITRARRQLLQYRSAVARGQFPDVETLPKFSAAQEATFALAM